MRRRIALCVLVLVGASASPSAQLVSGAPLTAGGPQAADQGAGRDYVVGPQDVLKIAVFEEPSLTGSFRVDADGTIIYPFLGRVAVAGQRVQEIESELRRRLSEGYLRRAQVSVEIEQFRSQAIFVLGEVRAPGKYGLSGELTLLEALVLAGSPNDAASSEVLILRPRTRNEGEPVLPGNEDAEVTRVSLLELQTGRLSQNVTLQDGDTVFVPRAERFYVSGYVRNPGAYVLEPGMTVLQAISVAGGLTERGSNRRLKIIRVVKGRKKELGVKLSDLVQPGDTLVVPQRLL